MAELVAFGILCAVAGGGGAWLTSRATLQRHRSECASLRVQLREAIAREAQRSERLQVVEREVRTMRRTLATLLALLRGGRVAAPVKR